MDEAQLVKFARRGNRVLRYHTTPPATPETVGHHSCGVAQLVWILTAGECSTNLLAAALFHDSAEGITGDVPYTAKCLSPRLKVELEAMEFEATPAALRFTLAEGELRVLKICDMLDLVLKCNEEIRPGGWGSSWVDMLDTGLAVLEKMCDAEEWESVRRILDEC